MAAFQPCDALQDLAAVQVRRAIAGWIEAMPPDNLPSELHLSHNRITPDGFHGLVQAIAIRHPESSDAVESFEMIAAMQSWRGR